MVSYLGKDQGGNQGWRESEGKQFPPPSGNGLRDRMADQEGEREGKRTRQGIAEREREDERDWSNTPERERKHTGLEGEVAGRGESSSSGWKKRGERKRIKLH